MNKWVTRAGVVLLLGSFLSQEIHAVTPGESATIINLAGRQRMLTQKMSKEMFLVALDIDREANRRRLESTADLFYKTLIALRDGDAKLGLPATEDARQLEQIAGIETLWREFHALVEAVAQGGDVDVQVVAECNLMLLKKANTLVRWYEKDAKQQTGQSAGVVINLAGKQRMLTQKMTKEALLVALDHDREANQLALRASAKLFEGALYGLKNGDGDYELPGTRNTAISAQLDVVGGLWSEFKPALDRICADDGKVIPQEDLENLSRLNMPLLEEMDRAVGMIEKAATQSN